MKKIFLTIVILFTVITTVTAQLNVTGTIQNEPEKLQTIRTSYAWLYKTSNGYVIWSTSSNRFDSYNEIKLGETIDQSLKTLNDLKYILDNKVAITEVNNGELILYYEKSIFGSYLLYSIKGNAGNSNITYQEIESLIKYFNNITQLQE